MAGPFYNCIKGTTAGTPGTGAFTPNAAASGFLAWSTVPTGWVGLVRYEDGSSWELQYSYWNGTTLSRSATAQFVSSSTGSGLTLTSSATAALVIAASNVARAGVQVSRSLVPTANSTTVTALGMAAATVTGTAAAGAVGTTNYLTEQMRVHTASATTANAQCGYSHTAVMAISSTTAGRGGWEFSVRLGQTGSLPTGPRMFVGMTATTFVANAGEPSAFVAPYAAFSKDSTDTNIQLITNSNSGAATKINTGMPLTILGWYEAAIWCEPGSLTIYALLIRRDTGTIFYSSTATDVPLNGSALFPQCLAGLSGTTGTAFTMAFGGYTVRPGPF
jgi:hypothetical protein